MVTACPVTLTHTSTFWNLSHTCSGCPGGASLTIIAITPGSCAGPTL